MGMNFGRALLVGLNEGVGRYDAQKNQAEVLKQKMQLIKMQQDANFWKDLRDKQFQMNLLQKKAEFDMQQSLQEATANRQNEIDKQKSPEYLKNLQYLDSKIESERARADKYRDDARNNAKSDEKDAFKQIMDLQKIRDNMYEMTLDSREHKIKVLKPGYSQDDVDAIGARISELRQGIAPYKMPDQPFIRGNDAFAPAQAGDFGNYWIGGNNGQTAGNTGQAVGNIGQDVVKNGQGGSAGSGDIGGQAPGVREDVVNKLIQRLP